MKDVTKDLVNYIKCSHDVYGKWFSKRPNGVHEFINIDDEIFEALVIDSLNEQGITLQEDGSRISRDKFFKGLEVELNAPLEGEFTFCEQKTDCTFGAVTPVEQDLGTHFPVREICPSGEYLIYPSGDHGVRAPIVELVLDHKRWILYSGFENLKFLYSGKP